jgi:hypothetical protein
MRQGVEQSGAERSIRITPDRDILEAASQVERGRIRVSIRSPDSLIQIHANSASFSAKPSEIQILCKDNHTRPASLLTKRWTMGISNKRVKTKTTRVLITHCKQ